MDHQRYTACPEARLPLERLLASVWVADGLQPARAPGRYLERRVRTLAAGARLDAIQVIDSTNIKVHRSALAGKAEPVQASGAVWFVTW